LLDYRQHLGQETFRADEFVAGLPLTAASTTFVHLFLKTQMFDRFIVERRENPFDPEVKFFDESIAAKIKRSKRTVFVNMGRQAKMGTAFLEDSSKLVSAETRF
jgi:dDENN domain